MQQPGTGFLKAILLYTVFVKVLPFLMMQFGMSITPGSTPYPWSLTPVLAVGIFSTACLKDLRWGFAVPILVWMVADLLIGLLVGLRMGWQFGLSAAFYQGQIFTYAGLIAVCACGLLLRSRPSWPRVLGSGLLASVLFFLVSNFGSWYFDISEGYARNFSGLLACYAAGLPFFRNYLLGTTLFSLLLFSPLARRAMALESNTAGVLRAPIPPSTADSRSPGD